MDAGAEAGEQGRGGHRDWSSDRQVIRWERFLPRRSLRVLLVEHDDSTRHIVAALLRKSSYRVAAVADGLKAWEVLKERHYSIDLVLTEVEMPSISGIDLLSKIMGIEECKNIPVIMMSSHDSIGVVLKCMLKGAVDFLVKPVRKNELRNLWQHVWRKHCSSSFASASGNNAASNHISANADDGSKTVESSDEGSDAQSPGSKQEMEIESAEKHMETQLADGRSFSMELEGKLKQPNNNVVMSASVSKLDDDGEKRDKPVEIGVEVTIPLKEASAADKNKEQTHPYDVSPYRREDLGYVRSREGLNFDSKSYNRNNAPNEPVPYMIDFMEPIAKEQCSSVVLERDVHKEDAHLQNRSNLVVSPLCELSLRRSQLNGFVQQEKERQILIHSNSSAFSRYDDKRFRPSCQDSVSSASCIRTGECVNSFHSYPSNHGTETQQDTPISPFGRFSSPRGNVGEATMYLQVPSESNKEDAGLLSSGLPREDTVFRHPLYRIISLPIPFEAAAAYQSLSASYGDIRPLMFYPENSLSPHCSAAVEKATIDHSGHYNDHINHSRPIESHSRHHVETHQPRNWREPIDLEPRNTIEQAYQNASCTQGFLKGAGSNGSGEAADAAANTGAALESWNESGVQDCNRELLDCDRSRREAALIKFRLKRKDRCFEKKVRYLSRKMLAEQRPRVKGQFVRQ